MIDEHNLDEYDPDQDNPDGDAYEDDPDESGTDEMRVNLTAAAPPSSSSPQPQEVVPDVFTITMHWLNQLIATD